MSSRHNSEVTLEQVLRLPRFYEQEVPAEYIDYNGHMNVMYYTGVGNEAILNFFNYLGLGENYLPERNRGFFALRQVLSYFSEIRQGERLAVHTGLAGYDRKRLHFIHYVVNLSRNIIASSDERVAMYIDLSVRRSTEFEPDILETLAKIKENFASTGWQPELSGAIQLKSL